MGIMRQHLIAGWAAALLVLPLGVAEAQQGGPRGPVMTISGEGSVQAPPDLALIMVGVVSEDERASAALSQNTQSMTRVLDALKAEGIEPRDLQTSGFSVQPVMSQPPRNYDHSVPFRPQILGYRVNNTLTVRIRDLDRVGALLDKTVALGANSVSGPNFTVENPQPLQDDARRVAMADALRKGALYAEAASVTLGPVIRIEEGFAAPPHRMEMRAAMPVASDAAVPIESGELTFRAQVSVSWRLRE